MKRSSFRRIKKNLNREINPSVYSFTKIDLVLNYEQVVKYINIKYTLEIERDIKIFIIYLVVRVVR